MDCSEVVDREAALDKLEAESRLFSFSGGRIQDKREITDYPQVLSRVLKNVLTKRRLGAKPPANTRGISLVTGWFHESGLSQQ